MLPWQPSGDGTRFSAGRYGPVEVTDGYRPTRSSRVCSLGYNLARLPQNNVLSSFGLPYTRLDHSHISRSTAANQTMGPEKSAERVMLELVAFHDPIDYHRLRRLVGEQLNEYSSERHREALQNLQELELICRPRMAHEYIHISEQGWEHLGGDTPRYGPDTSTQSSPTCEICATDQSVEKSWL